MGIRGLETYLERSRPINYCYEVNVQELADKYRSETGKTPVIVVDGPNCLKSVLCDRKDQHWILGGQLKEFVEAAKNFVSRFKKVGVDLKFFFGSIVPENKKDTWISRRNWNIKKVMKLFDILADQSDYSRDYIMPPVLGALARFALKYECECDTEVTLDEHDVAIARYAYEHDSFGILSQDTDYVLMDGGRHYFSLKHLNLDTLITVTYNREALKIGLNLQQHELLLLPPLLGCETLPLSKLERFQNKICNCRTPKYHNIFHLLPCVVNYIKGKNIPNDGNFDYLREIAVDVFGTREKAQDLEMCIRSYIHEPKRSESNDTKVLKSTAAGKWKKILEMAKEKHESCSVTAHLYPVMLGYEYELSIALENYSNINLVSTAEAYLPLRQRTYGILLYEKPHTNFVKEFCIQGKECPIEASEVPIKWISDIEKFHPGLCKLWSANCSIDMRWKLFVESLTEKNKLNAARLKELGFPYAVPVAVLYYLVEERKEMLTEVEIEVILAQAASLQHLTANNLKNMRNQLISGRAFLPRVVEISTIFLRGVTMVLFLLAACGFPLRDAMPWFYFDGKLLLLKYIQAVKERKGARELCDENNTGDVYTIYTQMKNLIMPVRSWRHQ